MRNKPDEIIWLYRGPKPKPDVGLETVKKQPLNTAEPATHSAEPATHSAVIPLNFREKWNLEKYYLRKLLNIMVMFARVRLQVVLQNVPSVVNIENQFDIV